MSKNVAVFVDVANIFYAAKAAGADIDYVTLLKAAVAGRDFVRAYAYTGLDPENENQRNFHSFLARHGYKVVSKDIRKYGDGKVKANLDIELVVDMMKTARNLDVAIVVSGDGDFAPAIRAVQEMGVRVEVISFRGNTSSDLIEAADVFYDITQVARVDRDSSRSGRRVAGDEEDLSMTEVPDKQTEGRGGRRGRGRGRGGRVEGIDEAVAAAAPEGRSRTGDRAPSRATSRSVTPAAASGGTGTGGGTSGRLVALPGEKLSRAAAAAEGAEIAVEEPVEEPVEEVEVIEEDAASGVDGTGRRRRRRGGRGRGHGHRDALPEGDLEAGEAGEAGEAADLDAEVPATTPRTNQFGSVWDSQLGMAGRPERLASLSAPADEDDFAEPEIPEYLLAERRRNNRSQGGGRSGGRGTRSAYASAVERERYGRSSTSSSRYPEPARQPQPQPQRHRDERPARSQQPVVRRGGEVRPVVRDSAEPWSEVPPELEELLRAQLSTKIGRGTEMAETVAPDAEATKSQSREGSVRAAGARRGGRRKPEAVTATVGEPKAAPAVEAPVPQATADKPKPPTRSRRKPAAAAEATASVDAAAPAGDAAPKRRAPARRKPAAAPDTAEAPASADE